MVIEDPGLTPLDSSFMPIVNDTAGFAAAKERSINALCFNHDRKHTRLGFRAADDARDGRY